MLIIFKNGGSYSYLDRYQAPAAQTFPILTLSGSDIVYLAATEYVDIRTYQNSGGAVNAAGLAYATYMSVSRVG